MDEAEVEMNKQCEGKVYPYGLIKRGEVMGQVCGIGRAGGDQLH